MPLVLFVASLGKHLALRYTPELTFKLDTTIAYGVRISRMLHDLIPTSPVEPAESDYVACLVVS